MRKLGYYVEENGVPVYVGEVKELAKRGWPRSKFDLKTKVRRPWCLRSVTVSTVFLIIDHNYSDVGPPLLYETMVFGGKFHNECARTSTQTQARNKHYEVCRLLRKGKNPFENLD